MEPTVHDVLAFHRVDRDAYEHLLSLGAGRHAARDTVALLMWFHRKACVDAVSRVRALVHTRAAAARLVAEVRAVLLRGADAETTTLMSCVRGEGHDGYSDAARVRRFLASFGRAGADATRRGVAEVLGGVGALVFDDRLHAILHRYEDSGDGGALPAELAAPYRRCVAMAMATAVQEEAGRSLFITFSKGSPLTREEVEEFFTERWGFDCVAKVMMEKAPPREPPTYGRIVFRRAATAAAVLAGQALVKLLVNGRHLWARKYVPRLPPPPPLPQQY